MMTDIELYKVDCKKYFEDLNGLRATNDPELEKKEKELGEKFRDKIRKYLPTCLNIINENFNCKFSLYKTGRDYNAAMKVIETKVKKRKEEVVEELNMLKSSIDMNSLSPQVRAQIDLASEILTTYVDDGAQPKFSEAYLQSATPVASSIIDQTPNMSLQGMANSKPDESSIQYNPYANQPIDFSSTNEFNEPGTKESINLNSFNNSIGGPNVQPVPTSPVQNDFVSTGIRTDNEYAYSDVIDGSALSIFGGNSNNN